jgi:moderate conductance mechanosensitive channel
MKRHRKNRFGWARLLLCLTIAIALAGPWAPPTSGQVPNPFGLPASPQGAPAPSPTPLPGTAQPASPLPASPLPASPLPASSPQAPPPQAPSSASPTPAPQAEVAPTSAVSRLVPAQWLSDPNAVEKAAIYLDGRVLFNVSAPAVAGQQAAEVRAHEIQQRLNTVIATLSVPGQALEADSQAASEALPDTDTRFEASPTDSNEGESAEGESAEGGSGGESPAVPANAIDIAIDKDEASNLPVILANDYLLTTVTDLDAHLSGYATVNDRATALADTLRQAFRQYFQERSPLFFRRQVKRAIAILTTAIFLQLAIRRLAQRLSRRQRRLISVEDALAHSRSPIPGPAVELSSVGLGNVFDQVKARLDNRQKRKLNETAQGFLTLSQPFLWVGSLLWICALFPQSRWFTTLLLGWLTIPVQIFLLCGLAYGMVRVTGLAIDKASFALQEGTQWAPDRSQRLSLRFSTFSQVAKGVAGSLIVAVTALWVLALSGVQIAPLLAGAGIVGLGISLAAQSLIKDIINGFLILLEDHFGIGDVISVDGLTGVVEYVNLRITQLRDAEGRLITIPNSQISIVQNLSMDWAQVDLSVTISPHHDVDKVLDLLRAIATNLAQDSDWQRFILEPPDILGIESLGHTGITLRLLLKTQPLKQWPVARELRRRIKAAFDAEGIEMGLAQDQIAVHLEEPEIAVQSKQE